MVTLNAISALPDLSLNSPKLLNINEIEWSRRADLNRRPADYESAALPLSYVGC